MKNYTFFVFILLGLIFSQACEKEEELINFSLPSKITITDYISTPTQVKVEWDAAPNVSEYILKHYIDDVFEQEYRTSQLSQYVSINPFEIKRHRFQIYTECEDFEAGGLNAYIDIIEDDANDLDIECGPPTNIEITSTTDTTVTFIWTGPANAFNYTVVNHTTTPPDTTIVDTNTFTMNIGSGGVANGASFNSICLNADGSSSESLFVYVCIASPIDIDRMNFCDKSYFNSIVGRATFIYVRDQTTGNVIISGSPTTIWNYYCSNINYSNTRPK